MLCRRSLLATPLLPLAAPALAQSAAAWPHRRGRVIVTSLGAVPVKESKEPVEIDELIRARPLRSRLSAAAASGLTRFVGREVEIEQLRRALQRAGGGHGQVVAVIGEPGVGKSRLFYEFIHSQRAHGW